MVAKMAAVAAAAPAEAAAAASAVAPATPNTFGQNPGTPSNRYPLWKQVKEGGQIQPNL